MTTTGELTGNAPWHIITGEYPPAPGGVSDYCRVIAEGLAEAGDTVQVWCPPAEGPPTAFSGVGVNAIAGSWSRADRDRVDVALNQIPGEKRLLLQWVPHAYGSRSVNVAFCRWIRGRARAGDVLDVMVHEPGLGFGEGGLRHNAAAAVHRLMLTLLLQHARKVWVAIPAWTECVRPWVIGRSELPFCWLPVPSTIQVVECDAAVSALRAAMLVRPGGLILGHFGTYPPDVRQALRAMVPGLLKEVPEMQLALLGRGSERVAHELSSVPGVDSSRIHAVGQLGATALSSHLQACDLLVQPYSDGASSRRTTLMAAMAHGLPIVTTLGRLSEPFWRDSQAIVGVRAGDIQEMESAVLALARQPERRGQIGSAARATYEARFSLAHVIRALRSDACQVNR